MKIFPLYNIAFSAVLASTAYVFALTGGEGDGSVYLLTAQAMILLLPGLSLFTRGYKRIDRGNLLLWAMVSIILLLNLLSNIGNYPTAAVTTSYVLTHMVGIVGMLFAIQWAATNLSPEALMRYLAICLCPLIALAMVVALQETGWTNRASPFGIHPNWWGELGFAFTAYALTLHSWKAKSFMIGMAMILFYLVQSRGALLAACVCIGVYIFFWMKQKRLKKTGPMLVLTAMTFAGTFLALQHDAILQAWVFLMNDVMLMNDSYRGVNTSLTGRLEGWEQAIKVFSENPIFGQGLDTLNEVHNGFLRLAGEGGLLLLLAILFMMGIAVHHSFKKRNYLVISIIFGYAAYAMTYPRMLNMNLASTVFYLCLFSWSKSSSSGTPPLFRTLPIGADMAQDVLHGTTFVPGRIQAGGIAFSAQAGGVLAPGREAAGDQPQRSRVVV